MNKYRVKIGTPARSRSVYVEATSADEAVKAAVEQLVASGEDREWVEKYAANRHPKMGTCQVEEVR